MKHGYTLIEILVVVSIFAVVAALTTQSLMSSLRSTRKSEAIVDLRENLEFALSRAERSLRNAKSIDVCTANQIDFTNPDKSVSSVVCAPAAIDGTIQFDGEVITSESVSVTNCNFACLFPIGDPPSASLSVTGSYELTEGAEGSSATAETLVQLRTY
ncbi:MAG: hypothetical protein UV74_C0013G0166 [Candidatus Woesebacteria bacterium GW2011_GWB1_43_14]|uniref:Uncharacterized protein n=1 Tax=Candidatus Woesebacteria bacterium GW2011_GWB1_43_14 TaxID=1618578 RepID=A0A0G1DH58_9BACT|nr:MAG: hypothetical protein UV51_C0005G0055 [Candidatus Woesebacteria bacterium GW2011_GWC1_42_9]KKS97044.1 MAG: hypothetical protein UV74_C0013G0166 [Candidatus Woesebacteria bacterium GW2011_GWB1_43_14]